MIGGRQRIILDGHRFVGNVRAGYEVLGSDNDIASFQTPLATLHGKNGWSDVFLTTPSGGLEDFYLFAGSTFPCDIEAQVFLHWFFANESGGDYGEEVDVVLTKNIYKNLALLAKFARFNGKSTFADRTKFWLQTEFSF